MLQIKTLPDEFTKVSPITIYSTDKHSTWEPENRIPEHVLNEYKERIRNKVEAAFGNPQSGEQNRDRPEKNNEVVSKKVSREGNDKDEKAEFGGKFERKNGGKIPERVLARLIKLNPRKTFYKVKWAGLGENESTWEDEGEVPSDLIENYNKLVDNSLLDLMDRAREEWRREEMNRRRRRSSLRPRNTKKERLSEDLQGS